MNHPIAEMLPEKKKTEANKQTISNEDIYKKLLELETRIKTMEERISKPLIG